MFDHTSRYYRLGDAQYTAPDGTTIVYKCRRFLPQGQALPLLLSAHVQRNDRMDLIAARTLGEPEQFWRLCDANDAMNPFDLADRPGRALRVPPPQV